MLRKPLKVRSTADGIDNRRHPDLAQVSVTGFALRRLAQLLARNAVREVAREPLHVHKDRT